MKRILVLLTITTLIVSMYAQVAVATDEAPVNVYISLNDDTFYYGVDIAKATVSGKIFLTESESLYQVNAELKLYKDDGDGVFDEGLDSLIKTFESEDGKFEFKIITSVEDGLGYYYVVGTDTSDYIFNNHPYDAFDSFKVVYKIELTEPNDLEWDYPVSGPIEIEGLFVNQNASGEDALYLAYQADFDVSDPDNTSISKARFIGPENFCMLFEGSDFYKTGPIGIYVNGVLSYEGEIIPELLEVYLEPDEAIRIIDATTFTAEFFLSETYLNTVEKCMNYDYSITYDLIDPDGDTIYDDIVLVDEDTTKFTDFTNLDKDFNIEFTNESKTGKYQILFELYCHDGNYVVADNTVSFKVVNPKRFNLVNWSLSEASVGDIQFALPYAFDSGHQNIKVLKHISSTNTELCEYLEVTVEGCGIDDSFKTFDEYGLKKEQDIDYTGIFEVSPSETGKIAVTIDVYSDETDDTPDYSITKKINIVGWNVTIEPSEVLVDYSGDITFTIVDEDGDPINNAILEIGDNVVVDGTSSSIINGIYTYSEDELELFKILNTLSVKLWEPSEYNDDPQGVPEIIKSSGIDVVGEEVYTVTSETTTLLNGINETVLITSKNENGDIIYPTYWRIDVDEDGDESDAKEITGSNLGSFIDLDEDGIKETRKITILPNDNQQAVIIKVTTDSGEKFGEVKIDVQKPQIKMLGVKKLTESFNNTIKATLIDPRNGSELNYEFYLKEDNDYLEWSSDDDFVLDDNEIYTIDVLVKNVDWTTAEEDEENVFLSLIMDGDGSFDVNVLDIPVDVATLTSNPERVIMNKGTNLVITYLDAEGKPIAEKNILINDEIVAETNENGQIIYPVSAVNSISLNFEAETDINDSDTNITLEVKSKPDTSPPVATVKLSESGDTAIVTITDNVRLLKSFVNGEEVNMFFPVAKVTHIVKNLASGDNEIYVISVDLNNNMIETFLTVVVNEPLKIKIGEPTGYGLPEVVEEITMVPVRLAEKLGAQVMWDNKTETATYTLGNIVISITVGSKTAIVNGVKTLLPVAPYRNEQNRVMVPLRMIAKELGFDVIWTSNEETITIK